MVTLRKRARTQETPANPKQSIQETPANPQELTQEDHQTKIHESSGCEYEESRAKRIKENMKRMQQLGILDLSLKLKAQLVPPKRSNQRKPPRPSPLASPSLPPRRSSRLQTVTPVIYSEIPEKKGKSLKDEGPLVGEGHKPEVYTEEHEKLLGTCEGSWTLFVDGYGKDGKRIYDPVNGKTCHQCRQKTMGHRTHCSECNLVQGQFCGDCLYMRYGEHVLEAKENPNWICPGCRGICNCSLCRQAKGWPATGMLYRKISALGFKSVAHYLIQTRRVDQTTSSGGDSSINLPDDSAKEEVRVEKEESQENTYLPVSAKRSLTFKEEMSEDQNHGFEDKTEKLRGEEAEVVGAT